MSDINNNFAVPFITYDFSLAKFVISPESKEILSKYSKIGVISLVGKYRTGKSFLLNRLIKNGRFEVGPSIKPCTKGIWLWSNPLMISNSFSKEEFPAFLVDTEGLGAYDEEINHDTKIFLIAILISSLLVYNSFGTIDEQALNNLSLIVNLSKNLRLRKNEKQFEINEIAKYFPSLLWVLRDFALKLEDNEGNVITAKQYLENALMEQRANEEKNYVRKLIKNYFVERDCFPIVRPVENEGDLQRLQVLEEEKLRPEFLEQSEILRNKIFMKVRPKSFNGKNLSGTNLFFLVESVIECINEGNVPIIENSWNYVINSELLKNIKENVEFYREKLHKFKEENFIKNDYFLELEKFNVNLIEEIIKNFVEKNSFDETKDFVCKLKSSLNDEFVKFNEQNKFLIQEKFSNEIDKKLNELFENEEKLKENYLFFFNDLLKIKDEIDLKIPNFSSKSEIFFEKIISCIKKYIDEILIKQINENSNKIKILTNENELIKIKFKNVNDEYQKDKIDFKKTIDKFNEIIIENKLQIKSFQEKIKNFDLEKKNLKNSNEISLNNLNKEFESKIEKFKINIEKLKNEIKSKEEEILLNNLNFEKISSLDKQKINFLQNELEQIKQRFNEKNKDFSEIKNQNLNLKNQIENSKIEIQNLKNFFNNNNNENNDNNNNNKNLLFNVFNNTNEIKEMIKNLNDFCFKNKDFICNNNNNNNNKFFGSKNNSFFINENDVSNFTISDSYLNKENINILNNENENKNNLNSNNLKQSKSNKNLSKQEKNFINISIIGNKIKKDETGKPFLEYLIEVKTAKKNYKISKKFLQFSLLNKTLKNLFKNLINLPDSGSLFLNINEMNGNSFHENKINQLDFYVKELCKIDIVVNSAPFKNFFELENEHKNCNENILVENKKVVIEKKQRKSSLPIKKKNFTPPVKKF